MSPSAPGSWTKSTSPSKTFASGVTISSLSVAMAVGYEWMVSMLPFM